MSLRATLRLVLVCTAVVSGLAAHAHYHALIGNMGVGKSFTCNKLCGTTFASGSSVHATTSVAEQCDAGVVDKYGSTAFLLDTVGFSDNTVHDGFSKSIIDTLRAMDGKWVCGLVVVYPCVAYKPTDEFKRSVQLVESIVGLKAHVLQSDYAGSNQQCWDTPDWLGAKKLLSSVRKASELPGFDSQKCKLVELPSDYEQRVRSEDFAGLKDVIDKHEKAHCDTLSNIVATADAQLSAALNALNSLPAPPAMETVAACPSTCLEEGTISSSSTFGIPPFSVTWGSSKVFCKRRGVDPGCEKARESSLAVARENLARHMSHFKSKQAALEDQIGAAKEDAATAKQNVKVCSAVLSGMSA